MAYTAWNADHMIGKRSTDFIMAQEIFSYKDAADMDASDSTQKALTSGAGLDMDPQSRQEGRSESA